MSCASEWKGWARYHYIIHPQWLSPEAISWHDRSLTTLISVLWLKNVFQVINYKRHPGNICRYVLETSCATNKICRLCPWCLHIIKNIIPFTKSWMYNCILCIIITGCLIYLFQLKQTFFICFFCCKFLSNTKLTRNFIFLKQMYIRTKCIILTGWF